MGSSKSAQYAKWLGLDAPVRHHGLAPVGRPARRVHQAAVSLPGEQVYYWIYYKLATSSSSVVTATP
jgi:hypothetical protein